MQPETRLIREEVLRRAVLAGDEAAWQTLYGESFDAVYRFASWRCGGRDTADDVVQEAWLMAVRQIREFDPRRGTFLAWMRGILVNVYRNQSRAVRRQDYHHRSLDVRPGAPATSEINHTKQSISMALDCLSQRHEAVLRAKYLDGLSVAEIAADWRETPKAIESLLTRAREAFREAWQKPD